MAHEVDWLLRGCTLAGMRAAADRPWRPGSSHGVRAVIRGDRLVAGRRASRLSAPPVLRARLVEEHGGVRVQGHLGSVVDQVVRAVVVIPAVMWLGFVVAATVGEGPSMLLVLAPVTLLAVAPAALVLFGRSTLDDDERELRERLVARFAAPPPSSFPRQPRRPKRGTGRPRGR